jgi:hypothetical protein
VSHDWPWPDQLDALSAAPANHRLLLDNDRVRVLDTVIEPGATTPMHTHRWPAVYVVLSWSDFVRRDADGAVMLDTRTAGMGATPPLALLGEPLAPHTLENVGTQPLRVISTELKPAPGGR